jgi:hypothetical protein
MNAVSFIFDRKRVVIYLSFLAILSFFVLRSASLAQEYKYIFLFVAAGGFLYDLRSSWAMLRVKDGSLLIHMSTAQYRYKLSFIEEAAVHSDLTFLEERHPSWTEDRPQRKGFWQLKDSRDGRVIWFAVDRYPVADIRAGSHRFIMSVTPEMARILTGLAGTADSSD